MDFSPAFTDTSVDVPVNITIYSVINSLLDNTTAADKVQITIQGNDSASLSDGTSLYSFFSKNEDLILKENQSGDDQ